MKKLLIMAFVLVIGSAAVYAQNTANALCLKAKTISTAYCANNQDVCTKCPVCEQGQLVYCENQPAGSQRNCCYRQKPTGAKSGGSQTVCEKFTWPEIIHRPRCFESEHCKNFPKLRCEDLVGNETNGRIPACCWEGPQPSEIGGHGGKGGNGTKSGSGPNGQYMCGDPGTEGMPKCTNPAQTDQKCCWQIYTKGGNKGRVTKGGKGFAPKAPAAKGEKAKVTSEKVTSKDAQ